MANVGCQQETGAKPNNRALAGFMGGLKAVCCLESCLILIRRASSTGRCNTIQCVDSTMLPQEKRSVWL